MSTNAVRDMMLPLTTAQLRELGGTRISSAFTYPSPRNSHHHLPVALAVLALHILVFWLVQTGTMYRVVAHVLPVAIPVQLLSDAIVAPSPLSQTTPKTIATPQPLSRSIAAPAQEPRPVEMTVPASVPSAAEPAPVAVVSTLPTANRAAAAPAAVAATAAPAPAPVRVELPSSDADYLQNPRPPYPPVSKRLNEQGTVIVRVLIGADGLPQKAELRKSSGYERLDQGALAAVMKWRYVPGKRAGIAETMWFDVPISFLLE